MEPTQQPMFFDTQGNLLIPGVHSPNYVAGTSGWSINKNGSAEFNNVVIRGGTVVSGTSLYYSGTPAAGNLIASIAAVSGTDAFGNPYLAGISTYDRVRGIWSNIVSGQSAYGNMSSTIPPVLDLTTYGFIVNEPPGGSGVLNIFGSSQPVNFTDAPQIQLIAGFPSITSGAYGGEPQVWITDANLNSIVNLMVTGQVRKQGLTGSAFLRTDIVANVNWAQGDNAGVFTNLKWFPDALDNVVLSGVVHATAAMGAGTHQINGTNIPAPFMPQSTQQLPGGEHTSSADVWKAQVLMRFLTSGAIDITTPAAIVAGDNFYVSVSFPLHNN